MSTVRDPDGARDGRLGPQPRKVPHLFALALLPLLLNPGCVYDPDDRCDANQQLEGELCVCVEGTVLVDGHCVECAENAHVAGTSCACDAGFVATTTGECVATALGAACVPEGAPCADPTYSTCIAAEDGGYCSLLGCASAEDCPAPFACDTAADPTFCRRPPTGLGAPCATNDDCSGLEASYCEALQSHSCQVADCSTAADCFIGWGCCDLTPFGLPTMCVPEGSCPV